MFTGIIENLGYFEGFKRQGEGILLTLKTHKPLKSLRIGESIAIDGCCLTLIGARGRAIQFEVSPETLRKTTLGSYKKGQVVNLERALRLSDRMGGHVVLGHVDTTGRIQSIKRGEKFTDVKISIPSGLEGLLVDKGSITVDGISLTICKPQKKSFSLYIIPHTEKCTNLHSKQKGDRVNLEGDVLGKYVRNLISLRK